MKFSVLLPTRNRLELLRYAVESVRRQDYSDWEIVVSDNASEEGVLEYLSELNDRRIRYVRTDSFVSVTENWNNALRSATGDFIIMLGDDDALMSGYFRRLAGYFAQYPDPDVVYTDAYQFAYPNVIPGHSSGFVQQGYTEFLYGRDIDAPFWLSKKQAINLVSKSMSFRISFGFNMQHYVVNRKTVEALSRGRDFYQSPYPDYYAANTLLLEAQKVLVVPKPMVVIGISPKSFGFFYFNKRESEGDSFLKHAPEAELRKEVQDVVLPGSSLMSCWLFAMETVKKNVASAATLRIDYHRYRLLQVYTVFMQGSFGALHQLFARLSILEMLQAGLLACLFVIIKLSPGRLRRFLWRRIRHQIGLSPDFDARIRIVPYHNILELIESEWGEQAADSRSTTSTCPQAGVGGRS